MSDYLDEQLPKFVIMPGGAKQLVWTTWDDVTRINMKDATAMEQALQLKEALQNSLYDVQSFINLMESYK